MRRYTKSITWRLQFWHAAILLLVIAGLSTAWYLQTRRACLSEIDADLLSAARVLDGSLRGIRLPGDSANAFEDVQLPLNVDRMLSLPRAIADSSDGASAQYFAIWLRDGRLLKQERLPDDYSAEQALSSVRAPVSVLQRGNLREIRIVGPSGTRILVGRNVRREFTELRSLAIQIVAISVGVLTIGLIGGWWLTRSVLRPIHSMSETATRFSAANMSPRIDVVETESELGELAGILNDAFDRVQSSFEQQQQFAADASHELRTPLAVIQSQIELALKRERTPGAYVKALTTCGDAGDRLSELVESLLTLARLDSGATQAQHCELRLDLIVAKCTDLMRPVAEHANVTLEVEIEPATMLGDPQQLERAVLNLLKNGISYNRSGGNLRVAVKVSEAELEFAIRDTGVGIGDDHIAHVTERFYRVDKARSRQQGGSGLGLSIARQIIAANNGTMQISSELNQGTTVTVKFLSSNEL